MTWILLGAVSNPVNNYGRQSQHVRDADAQSDTAEVDMVGLLKVASLVVGCKLLVGVQLGQVGRFGRLIAKHYNVMQSMVLL